jgi:hypothetical protein
VSESHVTEAWSRAFGEIVENSAEMMELEGHVNVRQVVRQGRFVGMQVFECLEVSAYGRDDDVVFQGPTGFSDVAVGKRHLDAAG